MSKATGTKRGHKGSPSAADLNGKKGKAGVESDVSLSPSTSGVNKDRPEWKADWPAETGPIDTMLHDLPHASSDVEWW